jgi:hypothetical protein
MSNDFIDLAQPRSIVLREGARAFPYAVPRIPQHQWFKYFDGIVSTAVRDGKLVVSRVDTSSAGVKLVDSMINYEPVPLAHRLGIANVLTSAYVPDQAMEGFGQVPLVAIWSADENGTMRRYKKLVHVFDEPDAEQNQRYRRDDSRSQIIGGSRKGTTVYNGAQKTLAALYDELIVSVAGYTVNGAPLEGREAIAREMDAYHKVAAVAKLFTPLGVELEEDEEDEEDE